jgi:hypothetical protein
LTIKAPGQIPELLQIEITHYHEVNNKIFDIDIDVDIDIDMNVWDNARNVIKLISFHRFHGPTDWLAYSLSGCISFIDSFIPISCCLLSSDCASMCLAIWLYSHVWPAPAELGTWRPSTAPVFDRLSLKKPKSILKRSLLPWISARLHSALS